MQFQHQWTSATERESQRCCTCKAVTSSKCRPKCGESIQYSLYLKVGGGGCFVKINIFTKQHFDLSLLKESANQIQFTFFFTKIMTLPDSRINELIVLMNG